MPRLELVETSLRHGQQSLLVSRLRQRHAVVVSERLDRCGFAALDVFGGSTFEACLRFLAEDPFDRLRALRAAAPITPLVAVITHLSDPTVHVRGSDGLTAEGLPYFDLRGTMAGSARPCRRPDCRRRSRTAALYALMVAP